MSVRARLTVVIGLIIAVLSGGSALLAPSLVEDALIDDILDAEADAQAFAFLLDEPAFEPDGSFPLEELSAAFEPDEVLELLGTDDLEAFIAAGGGSDLLVAIGENAFIRVDPIGQQSFEFIDPDELDQPVLTYFELVSLSASPIEEFGVFPDEDFGEDFVQQFEEPGRTVSGVRSVDGVELFVSGNAESVDRTLSRVRTALWLAFPLAVIVGVVVTWLVVGRSLRPVRAITEQAATITGGTLGERVPVPSSGDEIASLATTVNSMLDRLETDDARRRRFVSDASHEMRTPVAVLQSEAEVALRAPGRTDVEALATGVLAESNRMATMIDDLLALARQDEGVAAPTVEIDLDDIVIAEAGRLRRVPVDVSAVSAGRVLGRQDEFARVVTHLLDNAARHADTAVTVGLTTVDGHVELTVDDDGPGVDVADRAAIFERFIRLDEARSRDAGGAGLGLAVVAGVVQRSNGTVEVGDAPGGGARFVVSLPAP